VQVDAVEQRAGQPALVFGHAARVRPALAGKTGIVGAAAAVTVHRGDQHETRRIGDAVIDARDGDIADFQRLAQRIQHLRGEFRHSSRNSTPLWASEISPGRARKPPPTSAGMEAE